MNEFKEGMDKSVETGDIEIDLGRIFKRLLHFWWVIALLALIGAGIMFAYSKFMVAPQYSSTASLYIHDKTISPSVGDDEILDDDQANIKYNTVSGSAATGLQNTYKRMLTSTKTLESVIKELGANISATSLKGMVTARFSDYPIFDITVTSTNAGFSQSAAKKLTEVLQSRVETIVGGSSLTLIDDASVAVRVNNNTTFNTILGFLVGFIVGALVIVVIELANNKIYNNEYLAQKYGVSVLASITDFEVSSQKNYGYYKKYGKYNKNYAGGEGQ